MRKINKFVAIAILAAIATFSAPQTFAGVVMGDHNIQATDNNDKSLTGVVMGDFTGIILTDFTQALTGIMLSE